MIDIERFWRKTRPAPNGCCEWCGGLTNGYGRFSVGKRIVIAARFMYEYCYGLIPEGMSVDKTCYNKNCVAPQHLELVTHKESLRRWRVPEIISAEGRRNRSLKQLGERNHGWKGDDVGYKALHTWLRRRLPKPSKCGRCDAPPLDLANVSGEYKRDIADWEWLCRRCHMKTDGRLAQLQEMNHARKQ